MFFKKRKFYKLPRLFNKPIDIFNINVSIDYLNNNLILKNNLNLIYIKIPNNIVINIKENFLFILNLNNNIIHNCILGTLRSIIYNSILGLLKFYYKKLILYGVGYKAILNYNYLYLYLGYSHPIVILVPFYLNLEIISYSDIIVSGVDKQKVNQFSYFIKKKRKSDIYKGKGIRYLNEIINLKEFKKK